MTRFSRYDTIKEKPKFGNNKDRKQTPRDHTYFTLRPPQSELEDMRDGQSFKRQTDFRIVSPPYRFKDIFIKNKSHIYTGDLPGFNGRDVIAARYKEIDKGRKDLSKDEKDRIWNEQLKGLQHKQKWAMEIIDYRWFHFVPPASEDRYTEAVVCLGEHCPLCEHHDHSVRERHFGGRKCWTVGIGTWKKIREIDTELGWLSVSPENPELNGKPLRPGVHLKKLSCYSCGAVVLDTDALMKKTKEFINNITDVPHTCSSCGSKEFLNEVVEVDGTPVLRGGPLDMDITMLMSGEKCTRGSGRFRKASIKNVTYTLVIQGHSLEPLTDAGDFGKLPDRVIEIGKEAGKTAHQMLDEVGKPRKLESYHRPEWVREEDYADRESYVKAVLSSQAVSTGFPNPYTVSYEEIPF